MSAAVKERTTTHTTRKIVSHGGPISGQRDGAATASSLENNLDALLEDLQTSVSRSATPSRGGKSLSPQVIEYRVAANPTKVVSEGRPISPTRTRMTTTEKFVSTGPSGTSSGIPGLELLDAELQNVQPGQSKTIAYKQVSYQYNTNLDDSWVTSENKLPLTGAPLIDDVHETTYEESQTPTTYQSPEPIIKKSVVNRELVYGDSSTSRTKQTSPLSGAQRDVKYIHETSYQTEPRPVQSSTVTTVHANAPQEYKTIEYVPSPTPTIPINLAPGPNTKVTTTIKTYTYELPGAPETYLPGGSVPGSVVLPGEKTITYTLPRSSNIADKTVTYQTMTENAPGPPAVPIRYSSPSPTTDVTKKSTTIHKEAKFYHEEHGALPYDEPQPPYTTYRAGPSPTNVESKTTVTKKYYQVDGNYPNGHGPADRPDYPGGSTTVIYQNQPPTVMETHTRTVNRFEEYGPDRPSSDHHPPIDKPSDTTTRTVTTYYPQQSTQPGTTVYKFSNTTTTIPPKKNADDHEVLLPKPFPTGVQVSPTKPITNGEGPPKKLEDLMASFSDSEREVLEDIEKQERQKKKESSAVKKEVDFVPHTPPKVKSKNVAGPPVYYPPGSAEFTKKEESSAAMSQSGGEWQKASGKYEYEASSKSKSKSSKGGAVVPVCLPLCCALPCVIM
ncbi:PREDICTED: soluble scavenger receptor cysteine-rich domain-containing protein SSC5D isoform X2 [Dinoponera quadriceps]|uniref:Soluble scavenger receptor cysteine-rich domain-containing protein SSC5D isoform X2 n=1 Tax=Dinoponera quadriceps TaxID=609295 RepID=A0A6P3Y7C1_DINQU|nr:PREDICTED: soluble scavenger receptor cysteine-rich domain-containing protein SSC5D isoform X2 [Dinoponera quadriceps]